MTETSLKETILSNIITTHKKSKTYPDKKKKINSETLKEALRHINHQSEKQ